MPPTTVTTKCTRPNQQHTAPFFQKPQLFILLHRVVFTVKVLDKVSLLDFTLDLSMTSCIATGQIITTWCNGSREKLTIASQWWNCQIATKLAKKWKITSCISLALFLHFKILLRQNCDLETHFELQRHNLLKLFPLGLSNVSHTSCKNSAETRLSVS